MISALRSLRHFNYRVWAAGALVSNVGTWMQRTAMDWLVLTQLTHHSASAVGTVMALQFGPQLIFLPWIGYAADHFDRRKLVMTTQAAQGLLALLLGLLTLTGLVELWHVFVFSFLSGSVAAFDAPARQTFVADLVGEDELVSAVALNSTSFNGARMMGPAIAGVTIAAWGTGWAFLANGISFFAVLGSLCLLRRDEIHMSARAQRLRGSLLEGWRYILGRDDLRTALIMLFLIGTLGLNFPIFISTMSVTVFGMGAGRYGLLTSMMAIGTVTGAFLAAGRERPSMRTLTVSAGAFGLSVGLAAAMPSYWWFAAILLPAGMATLTFTNTSNTLMQLATEPAMRGRVVAIRLSLMSGVTLVGAPIIGLVADHAGPRWAMGIGALSGLAAAAIGLRHLRDPAPVGPPVEPVPAEDDEVVPA